MLCDVSLLRYAWCCTIWLFNTAIENPLSLNGGMNGKIIYKWVIYTMAMLNNQRVPHFHVQLSYLCGPTLASPLSQASSNVSQVELRHVLQRLQSLGPQKQVPGRPGTSGHGEVGHILGILTMKNEPTIAKEYLLLI